ncbi:MAG: lppS, partial [Pseudonocardiales bacterium]|nr:lppS [Pseudonocardiales bacterium]
GAPRTVKAVRLVKLVPLRRFPSVALAGAAVIIASVLLGACTSGGSSPSADGTGAGPSPSVATSTSTSSAPATAPVATPTPSPTPTSPVHATLLESDGVTYGVGMPIVMRFDVAVTDKTALQKAATVKVNGVAGNGSWYWFTPTEAHYRPQAYWPAHATITMDAPLKGLSAGDGLAYNDSLTLRMLTGAANISTVDASALQMTVTSDGAVVRTIPVSLGKAETPTYSGVKVIEEKDAVERMVGPGYDEQVPWSLRITNSGEYVHAAAWNSQIGSVSTSNGCTNLSTDDAKWMFDFSLIGDIVTYPNAAGGVMPSWDGYGDWNLDWATWSAGGAL